MSTNMAPTPKDCVAKLLQTSSPSEELHPLEQLVKCLSACDATSEDDIEQQYLSQGANDSVDTESPSDPFPSFKPVELCSSQSQLDRFTSYLFVRRFSWSEAKTHQFWSSHDDVKGRNKEKDAKLKGKLNSLLDDLLKWYLCQDVSHTLLKSLQSTISHANDLPVVRNQTMIHVMEWLQLNTERTPFHSYFPAVQSLILCGVCDVWSAIRNACILRLGCIINTLTLEEVEGLFLELAKICESGDSCWQSVEGALMAMTLIVKSFQWISVLPPDLSQEMASSSSSKYYLKFGEQELTQLPVFISGQLRTIVYPLLAHPQLGVRENATKALSTYLSRCEFRVALDSLQEAISKLRQDKPSSQPCGVDRRHDHTTLQSSRTFLPAYEAEGLLSVCLYLIKHLQSGVLIPGWPDYFTTLSLYLMHPASTVRQSTSLIFKYIVAKESNNPGFLKLVLQALCANWAITMDTDALMSTRNYTTTLQQQQHQHQQHQHQHQHQHLHQQHQDSLLQEDTVQNGDFCDAWEWREGRLFAYELIVKFLIINHIHYLFPAYALPPSKFDGSVSADAAIIHSRQFEQRPVIIKSLSHGGSSMTCGTHTTTGVYQNLNKPNDSCRERSLSTANEPRETVVQQQEEGSKSLTRTASERHKMQLQDKRSITLAEGTVCKRQLRKHYSYYTNQVPAARGRKGSQRAIVATSLLCKARNLDATMQEENDDMQSRDVDYLVLPSPMGVLLQPLERETLPSDVAMLVRSASRSFRSQDVPGLGWLESASLKPLSASLRQVLLQTITCHGDARWEVRRMAQQALPLITECIRWYDMTILTQLWNKHLLPTASLMSYGLALTLAASVNHAVRLAHFMATPPVSWRNPDEYRGITLPIITAVTDGLPAWCRIAQALVDRDTVDKLTVVAMEILMTAHTYLPDILPEGASHEVSILRKLLHVFCHAHPHHSISLLRTKDDSVNKFNTPLDGMLCCTRPDCNESPSHQVERYLVTELHPLVPVFLQSCSDVAGTASVLTILLHHIGAYHSDSHITRYLLEGCMIITNQALMWLQHCCRSNCCHGNHQSEHEVRGSLESGLREVTHLIVNEHLELGTLKQVLDLSLTILSESSGLCEEATSGSLRSILVAIATRLNASDAVEDTVFNTNSQPNEVLMSDLVYLSNNIPSSPVDNQNISSDEEDEDKDQGQHRATTEPLSLSVGGSGNQSLWLLTTPSSDQRQLSSQDVDESSDWDSWDEEPEDQLSFGWIVSDYMQRLQTSNRATATDSAQHSMLVQALHQLEEKDKSCLKKYMDAS